ncbi:Aldolase-type TIM barrel [Penicillium concentricum]|uniref:Aldolase-type TIM barrel n=1 Tax=Penicillium concentricum TaxID=293559 RepID=A0A9W9SSS2_9EURO|nr:Aldolase-type TIM barrel [Penicillium concentricum]KAJ5383144.1 Aldolase-type TIM barrel [Penicillium concentricum]
MPECQINLLQYLRSKTQVDVDSFDVDVSTEVPGCVDATSNQAEIYCEMIKPRHESLVKEVLAFSAKVKSGFPTLRLEELAFEVMAIRLAFFIIPNITGAVHVMANPCYSYHKERIVETGKRLHKICNLLDPTFDTNRLVMKVVATWEGLQACRELKLCGIKTLATAVFTMEQAVLAGEAGCVSISPFVHELKVFFDEKYSDEIPLLSLCVQAQQFYKKQSMSTTVKACATISLDELLQLAGVDALTIMTDDLHNLQKGTGCKRLTESQSLFDDNSVTDSSNYPSYLDDESTYRLGYSRSGQGAGQYKLMQVLAIFSDFQLKGEEFMKAH